MSSGATGSTASRSAAIVLALRADESTNIPGGGGAGGEVGERQVPGDGEIVVAGQADRGVVAGQLDAAVRVGAVADQVAQAPHLVDRRAAGGSPRGSVPHRNKPSGVTDLSIPRNRCYC